ncbi:hypothetical protein DFQ28_005958 [Apophysomyces sp. BC1034]|nr:hypothetical protein DFQ30_008298 [Apophysomyces sp. BC1015]KAG0181807.1 hypothetical protein DFQ29_007035 [Apophysomyces sp. BC1021]KAG0187701.1 hypothetical protein DFQ28_005958 [Apophysomyces sp. BC1034]
MRSTIYLFALAAAVVYAAPGSNTPELIRAPIYRKTRTVGEFLTARRKQMMAKRGQAQTSLYNDGGSQYLIEVGIGTPAQKFIVTLDTGSADLWVPSSQCPTTICPYARFDGSQSSSFKSLNQEFVVKYGIGTVNGTYATDSVTVAGTTVQNQQFGLASTTSDILTTSTYLGSNTPTGNQTGDGVSADGILGMGYPRLTAATTAGQQPYNPVVFNMVAQKLIPQPVFSIYLNKGDASGWAGEIVFGGIDDSKYTGNLAYLPVASIATQSSGPLDKLFGSTSSDPSYYYWMVYGQGIQVQNGQANPSFQFASTTGFIFDTGTTLTYLPTDIATEIVTAVAGPDNFKFEADQNVFAVNCQIASSKATVEFQMSSTAQSNSNPITFKIPASQLVIPMDAATPEQATACVFGISVNSKGSLSSNTFLIGDSVLRSAYLVFDLGNNRIGIAAANGLAGAVNGVTATPLNSASSVSPTFAYFATAIMGSLVVWLSS